MQMKWLSLVIYIDPFLSLKPFFLYLRKAPITTPTQNNKVVNHNKANPNLNI